MIFFGRLAFFNALYYVVPCIIGVVLYRIFFFKPMRYKTSVATVLLQAGMPRTHYHTKVLYWLRLMLLMTLALLTTQPQLVDSMSKIKREGIDIVLVLDVSGSMQFQDFDDSNSSRLDVAKREAVRFVTLRENDALGLVIFGKDALSRCPITDDKSMLIDTIQELYIGIINPEGTALCTAMISAANRLKNATAKSKIMIVLTDGEPSDSDVDPALAIQVAHALGIKIYTIGIGSDKQEFLQHPLYGLVQKPKVNVPLLTECATRTGGQFFMARNARAMQEIYTTIDQLEKNERDIPLFSRYVDLIMPLGYIAYILLCIEIIATTFMWFTI